jgi:hypothetical protein
MSVLSAAIERKMISQNRNARLSFSNIIQKQEWHRIENWTSVYGVKMVSVAGYSEIRLPREEVVEMYHHYKKTGKFII